MPFAKTDTDDRPTPGQNPPDNALEAPAMFDLKHPTLDVDPPRPGDETVTPSAPAPPGPPDGNAPAPEPPTPPAPETPATRFKDHAEAEKGYLHVRSHATKVEAENARLREQLAQRETDQRQAAEEAQRMERYKAFSSERYAKLMNEIAELDPDAEDHAAQLGRLYADAQADTFAFWSNPPAPEPNGDTPAGDTPPAPPDSADALPPAPISIDTQDQVNAAVDSRMADEGIAPQDPVFVQKAKSAPAVDADGQPLAFEAQLDWCVRETESYYVNQLAAAAQIDAQDPVLQYYIDNTPRQDGSGNPVALQTRLKSAITQAQHYLATQRGEAVQQATAPLSVGARFGGGGNPPPAEQVQPMSLKGAFDGARSHRTL